MEFSQVCSNRLGVLGYGKLWDEYPEVMNCDFGRQGWITVMRDDGGANIPY